MPEFDRLKAQRSKGGELPNRGWVRHTIESAVWGLLTTDSFIACQTLRVLWLRPILQLR